MMLDDAFEEDGDVYLHMPDEAMPLVEAVEEAGAWSLRPCEATLELLSKIEDPLVVVSVAGPYRSGKSSLLNWLAGCDQFEVGHGVRRCTRGLWVTGRPRRVALEDGSHGALLLVDSEGMGGLEAAASYDSAIFALTALLSSTLIYNSLGSIDERAIQDLGFVAKISTRVLENEDVIGRFMWVLRDFALELVSTDGSPIEAATYLETALAARGRRGDFSTDVTREALKTFFRRRDCLTLPRPYATEQELQGLILSGGSSRRRRPEFANALGILARQVMSRLEPKRVAGVVVRGASFGVLTRSYASALRGDKLWLRLEPAWEAVAASEMKEALERAKEMHHSILTEETEARMHLAHLKGSRAADDFLTQDFEHLFSRARRMDALEASRGECDSLLTAKIAERRLAAQKTLRSHLDENLQFSEHDFDDGDAMSSLQQSESTLSSKFGDEDLCNAALGANSVTELARLLRFCSTSAFIVARGLLEAHNRRQETLTDKSDRETASLSGKIGCVQAELEATKISLSKSQSEFYDLTSRFIALEVRHGNHEKLVLAEKNRADSFERDLKAAQADIEDAAAAVASEQLWQTELTERLEDRTRAHNVERDELLAKLAKTRRLQSKLKHAASSNKAGMLFDHFYPPAATAVEEEVEEVEDDAGERERLENYLADFDVSEILPKLEKLGARSVGDLAFLVPTLDFEELGLDLINRRKLERAVHAIKDNHRLGGANCAIS